MINRFWVCCMKKVLRIGKQLSSYLKYKGGSINIFLKQLFYMKEKSKGSTNKLITFNYEDDDGFGVDFNEQTIFYTKE